MSARKFSLENELFKDERPMRLELTRREIELLLMLMNDAATEDFSFDGPPVFSVEELSIIKKLEAALASGEILNKKSPGHVSESHH